MINEKPFLVRVTVNNIDPNNSDTPNINITTYNILWDKDGTIKTLQDHYDFVFKKDSLGDVLKQIKLIEELNPGLINSIHITQ